MAYVRPEDEEQDQRDPNAPGAPQVSPLAAAVGGMGVGGGTTPGSAPGPKAPAAKGAPTSFVAFDQYLAANKPGIQRMVDKAATKVEQGTPSAMAAADAETAEGVRAAVESVKAPTLTTGAGGATTVTPGTSGTPPTTFTYTPGTKDQVTSMANLQKQLTTGQGGLQDYAKGLGSQYSTRDAAMMGAGGREQLRQAATHFGSLEGYLGRGEADVKKAQENAAGRQAVLDADAKRAADRANQKAVLDAEKAAQKVKDDEAARLSRRQAGWRQSVSPAMAKLGEDVWNQMSDDEVRQFMQLGLGFSRSLDDTPEARARDQNVMTGDLIRKYRKK